MSSRPLCWSLHKYFKSSQHSQAEDAESQLVAVQPIPLPRPSWKAAQAEQEFSVSAALVEYQQAQGDDMPLVQCAPKQKSRKWKGGRPQRARGAQKARYTALSGQQKVWLVEEVSQRLQQPGATRLVAFRAVAAKLGCTEDTARKIFGQKDFWEEWAVKNQRKASLNRGTTRRKGDGTPFSRQQSKGMGCRLPGGGRKDFTQVFTDQTQVWAELEAGNGHELGRLDLLAQFRLYLDSGIAEAQDRQAAGTLSPDEAVELSHWLHRQQRLTLPKAREKFAVYLLVKTGWVERSKQRTTALSVQQEIDLCEAGWAQFDKLLWRAGCGSPANMRDYVLQPERWILAKRSTVISMSDQVPVWCKPDSGKRLMPKAVLAAASKARAKRKRRWQAVQDGAGDAEADEQPRTLVCSAGNAANSRSRYTLVARQLVRKYFEPDCEPVGASFY